MYVVYAQRNVPGLPTVPWADQRLGTCNGIYLKTDGCYTTAEAQVLTHYEHPITPGQWDDLKTARGGYVNGCQSVDGWLSKAYPDVQYVETKSWPAAADLAYLRMADDEEVIIGLDNLNQGAKARHFARVFDYNPATGVLLIDDPWWGRTLSFATMYGAPARNVMKAIKYRRPGWVPPWKRAPAQTAPPVVVAPIIVDPAQLEAVKAALNAATTALTAQTAALQAAIAERDTLRMAWTHLDTTFAEVRASIPK